MLKTRPETYETLLKENFDNRNTLTNLLRNKFSIWVRFHFVMCGVLEGSRFGKKVFFHKDKPYTIVILRVKSIFSYHYCSDIEEIGENELLLKTSYKLETHNWVGPEDKMISRGEMIKWF